MHFATVLLPNCLAFCLLVITLEFLQEINGFPAPVNPHMKRRERGFKYVPLNSMTLSKRKQPAKDSAEVTSEEQQTPKEDNEGRNKRPWWESLPSNKNQKNKVILDEYDKIKSSAPKWPWMTALKEGSGNSNPITRKKTNRDKVRVVMTTAVPKLQMPETTVKPLIIMSPDMSDMEEENIMPLTTVTSEDDKMSEMTILKEMPEMTMVKKMTQMMKEVPEMTIMEKMSEMAMMKEMSEMTSTMKQTDEMSTAKSENITDWLEAYNNRAETTKKPIDWFASWSPSTTTDNPFKYKINSGKETSFPVIEVNGPPIKLPYCSTARRDKASLIYFRIFIDELYPGFLNIVMVALKNQKMLVLTLLTLSLSLLTFETVEGQCSGSSDCICEEPWGDWCCKGQPNNCYCCEFPISGEDYDRYKSPLAKHLQAQQKIASKSNMDE